LKVKVARTAHFNAAHRLNNPNWSVEKNKNVFGKCNNPNFHGHNYSLTVEIIGDIDADTGYVVDLGWLGSLIKTEIENRFDHKNLNLDCKEFANVNPTSENIVVIIYQILKPKLRTDLLLNIKLYETERNLAEYGDFMMS
jgi:6-pyruvoyltetrahydropterin/6-carboxytetrahydropterin synthase|tara:strand:+ start:1495 stop:1914 length:420 start_codon:yes stop_codon:yes gene_type:complete